LMVIKKVSVATKIVAIKTFSVAIKWHWPKLVAIWQHWRTLVTDRWPIMFSVIVNGSHPFLVAFWEPSNGNWNNFQLFDGDWFSKRTWRYICFNMQHLGSYFSTCFFIWILCLWLHIYKNHRVEPWVSWSGQVFG
jgi:hypothetical protein